MKPHHPAIRQLLRQYPDGLTTSDIQAALDISSLAAVHRSLKSMPDVYVDRWTLTRSCRGQYMAVYCIVTPPPNCPYPIERKGKNHEL